MLLFTPQARRVFFDSSLEPVVWVGTRANVSENHWTVVRMPFKG